jgi:hypothetical protein
MRRENQKGEPSISEQGSQGEQLNNERLLRDHVGSMLTLAQLLFCDIAMDGPWPN